MLKGLKISEDVWVKAVSLFLAVMIWLAVKPTIRPDDTRDAGSERQGRGIFSLPTVARKIRRTLDGLPVAVLAKANAPRRFSVFPSTIAVTVAGPEDAVDQLAASEIEVSVDLTDVVEATGLSKSVRVRLPAGLTVEKRDPPAVEVKIMPESQTNSAARSPKS